MQHEATIGLVWVLVQVVDSLRVEGRGPALDAVHFVALLEQEFCQVGAVLAGDAGDQSLLHGVVTLSKSGVECAAWTIILATSSIFLLARQSSSASARLVSA